MKIIRIKPDRPIGLRLLDMFKTLDWHTIGIELQMRGLATAV